MKVTEGIGVPNPLLEPRITGTLEKALVSKGYERVAEPLNADFVVSFTVGSRARLRTGIFQLAYYVVRQGNENTKAFVSRKFFVD
jgi:hypothetical protein